MARFRLVFTIILLLVVVAATVFWFQRNKPILVQITEVSIGEVQRTVTNTRAGTLNACRRARLSPSLGGQIASLPVSEGETVTRGQILFEIWNLDLRARVELAQSELIASKALQQQSI